MNYDIFKKNFHPVSSNPFDIGDWKTFLEFSRSANLIWGAGVGTNIDIIDLDVNAMEKLYVFTDEFPADQIYDFIYPIEIPNFQLVDVQDNQNIEQLAITTLNITEIQLSKEIGVCFWKKVLDSIKNNENIDGFENEYNNRRPRIMHLSQKSFREVLNSLEEDDRAKILIGRSYLISLILGDVDIENNSLSRQYILYMFVDKNYFVRTLIDGMGLKCEN